MAHYAFLNKDNIVIEVIVGKDESDKSENWEEHYGSIKNLICKRTSYNTELGKHNKGGIPFRKNYAGIGYYYNETLDAFIPPKPYDSWVLNTDTCVYEAPIEKPELEEDGSFNYYWDEETLNWKELE